MLPACLARSVRQPWADERALVWAAHQLERWTRRLALGLDGGEQATALNTVGGQIMYRFQARDVNLVMGSAAPGTLVRFRVLFEGQPLGAAHGADADDQCHGAAAEPRPYQLIRQP